MKSSEDIKELAIALNKFQAQLQTIARESEAHKYKYADYASIWNAIRDPLTENGLSVFQDAYTIDGNAYVSTRVMHSSGQWIETNPLHVPQGKKDAHATGSACTYARRYSLSAALGIVPDDDDGAKAQEKAPEKPKQKDVNPVRWTEWAMQQFPNDNEMIDTYLLELEQATGKARNTLIQLLGQDDDVFKAKFKLWLNDRGGDDA